MTDGEGAATSTLAVTFCKEVLFMKDTGIAYGDCHLMEVKAKVKLFNDYESETVEITFSEDELESLCATMLDRLLMAMILNTKGAIKVRKTHEEGEEE